MTHSLYWFITMKQLYTVGLGGAVRWNLSDDEPKTWPAVEEPDIELVNPLIQLDEKQPASIMHLGQGRYHVVTNSLHVVSAAAPPDLFLALASWLRLLRVTARQATLSTQVIHISSGKHTLHGKEPKAAREGGHGVLRGEHWLHTGLNTAAIQRAYRLKSEAAFPLYHELLLDAIQAFESRRYRESILFSAIATESLAQYELNHAYESALKADPPPAHLNIIGMPLAGGEIQKKDPIYKLLTENDNFARLLHEAPLYLLRRSLLNDDPELFRKAKTLYGTRNRLSHGQTVTAGDGKLLAIDEEGAGSALQIAVDVFTWFGQGGYRAPDRNLVHFDT